MKKHVYQPMRYFILTFVVTWVFWLTAIALNSEESSIMIMIFGMSFVGHDITDLIRNPIKLVLAAIAIFLLWLFGKAVEVRLNKKVERDLRNAEKREHGGEI